ncbi:MULTISPECIES: outer membrane lipoprotein [Shewanella]|uniref:Glycine zipper 2TM domain-containing protein n=1 Tax=Shewanella fidelis TaxID=173509 RepID=A0AAW8NPA9_9GAMM|nr:MULTISPECIES: glycine zipper 2TM domain-containing protein [Shewanella]MDR8524195.1 glycine zipper 2TM domain-containing protein [Shewanella fidelis]MDW4810742.1 glycine zipper 2TM domain-containing protein [Shewanella fidelis]MDW4814863.1 glycine zipper 2TM domain-containing protein [Shewanella fidelis]MDW4818953.1 glycine zipper 2TM domain-containing protein [Shewanella fidelis]MDW4823370.1 glycine zipper 2TM domain-containing protein [Shewanella fidelis]
MLKPYLVVFTVICLIFSSSAIYANPYNRNQAVPVEKVEFGQVSSVRNITEKQLVEDRNSGWKTFGGALIGGVIGHQFGGGSGQDVATVLGALLGAGVGNRYGDSSYYQELKLVEMMITLDSGEQVMVIQDFDQGMVFNVNDEVRVVYLQGYVRVDRQM